MQLKTLMAGFVLFLAMPAAADSQVQPGPPTGAVGLTYADLADLSLAAPIVAHVRLNRATALRPEEARSLAPQHRRFLIEADVVSLIRGPAELPARLTYLVDLPNDWRGRAPRLPRRSEFLIMASAVAGRPGELRLVAPDAQLPFSPTAANQVREILREAVRQDAPPQITGIGRAFHVAGTLPGESESQIFLQTADQRPISVTVLRRPNAQPQWGVAFGELVTNAAPPPRPNTLAWHRLACSLPRTLPPQSLADSGPAEARALVADYQLVLTGLGPCQRNRRLPPPRA